MAKITFFHNLFKIWKHIKKLERRLKGTKANNSSFSLHTFICAVVMTAGAVSDLLRFSHEKKVTLSR